MAHMVMCLYQRHWLFEADFLSFVRTQHGELLNAVNASGALSEEHEKTLAEAMKVFKASNNYAS